MFSWKGKKIFLNGSPPLNCLIAESSRKLIATQMRWRGDKFIEKDTVKHVFQEIPQSSSITGASPSDCLGHSLGVGASYYSAE